MCCFRNTEVLWQFVHRAQRGVCTPSHSGSSAGQGEWSCQLSPSGLCLVCCLLQGCVLSVVSFRAAVSVCCLLQGCVLSVVSFRAAVSVCCLLQGCVLSVVSFRAAVSVCCLLQGCVLSVVSFRAAVSVCCLLQGCVLSVVSFRAAVSVCCLHQGCVCLLSPSGLCLSVVSFRAAVSCQLSPSELCHSVRLSSLVCEILQGSQIAPHVFLFSHSKYAEECSDVWGGLWSALWTELYHPEVTLCGWQDVNVQLLMYYFRSFLFFRETSKWKFNIVIILLITFI